MGVYVAQVHAAKLGQVVSFYPSDVITVHGVVAVPVASAHVLIVGVVRNKYGTTTRAAVFAPNLQSCRVSCNIWYAAGISIGPPVTSKAKVEVICEARPNLFDQASCIDPGILGFLSDRGILALGISGKESTDVPLVGNSIF